MLIWSLILTSTINRMRTLTSLHTSPRSQIRNRTLRGRLERRCCRWQLLIRSQGLIDHGIQGLGTEVDHRVGRSRGYLILEIYCSKQTMMVLLIQAE